MNKVKYMSYRRPDGRRYKPTDALRRLSQCRELGSRLEHSMPGGNILTDAKFLLLVWNIFPKEMQEWLTNDQKIDPFDPNHPGDVDEVCDDLHRYWSIHFKNEKVTTEKNKNKGDQPAQPTL